MCFLRLLRGAQGPAWVEAGALVCGCPGAIPALMESIPLPCSAAGWGIPAALVTRLHQHCWPQQHHPVLWAVAVTTGALFQRAAYSHPLSFPHGFFISFSLGIRHVLTEQTFCCSQNPPLRRAAMSSLCRCPEPVLGWQEPGIGAGAALQGESRTILCHVLHWGWSLAPALCPLAEH